MGSRLWRTLNAPILEAFGYALTCKRLVGNVHSHAQANRGESKLTVGAQDECFKYRVARPPDFENVVNFMNHVFVKHDPALCAIGLSEACSIGSLGDITRSQVEEGLTIIAVNSDNCLVGAAINIGCCPWEGARAMEYARCCETGLVREILEFFAYVTIKPDLWRVYQVYKIFECTSIAVEPEVRCRGIAKRLIEESWVLARDCGYRLFRIDCTSKYTAQIAENFSWQRVLTLPYCRYVKNGELIFKNIEEPHTEVRVYVDPLTHYTSYYPPYKKNKSCLKKE